MPLPINGSRIISFFCEPAFIHGIIKSDGNTAKCASLYGLFVILQTDLLFLVGYDLVNPE